MSDFLRVQRQATAVRMFLRFLPIPGTYSSVTSPRSTSVTCWAKTAAPGTGLPGRPNNECVEGASLQSAGAFDVELALFSCFFRRLSVLARYDVGGIPARPVVLRSRRFVLAMMLLCLA